MELSVKELQQLRFEIEGKVVRNLKGETMVLMDGILNVQSELNQKQKVQLRKKSKEIASILEPVGEQEKALLEEYCDILGTEEQKLKNPDKKDEFETKWNELHESKFPLSKVEGLSADLVESITGTRDFYENLITLQTS